MGAVKAECILTPDDGGTPVSVPMLCTEKKGAYDIFSGSFSLSLPGLYFYHFVIYKPVGSFRLFKYGSSDTNMEAGDLWQLTCTPADFVTPDWAKGV